MELPRDKRPTDKMIFDEGPEELESWLNSVLSGKSSKDVYLEIDEREIE